MFLTLRWHLQHSVCGNSIVFVSVHFSPLNALAARRVLRRSFLKPFTGFYLTFLSELYQLGRLKPMPHVQETTIQVDLHRKLARLTRLLYGQVFSRSYWAIGMRPSSVRLSVCDSALQLNDTSYGESEWEVSHTILQFSTPTPDLIPSNVLPSKF